MLLPGRRFYICVLAGLLPLVGTTPTAVAAQSPAGSASGAASVQGTNDVELALGNGLVGALYAGVAQKVAGGSFRQGFLKGFAGGLVHYLGKRVSVSSMPGRQLAGRVVAGTGAAIVVGAAERAAFLDQLFIPLGPFGVEFRTKDGRRGVVPSVDLYDLVVLVRAYSDSRYTVNWEETFASGVVVVDGCCRVLDGRSGATAGSIVFVEEGIAQERLHVVDHEVVHVLQRDFINRVWFYPLERRVLAGLLDGFRLPEQIRIGIFYPGLRDLLGLAGVYRNGIPPLETEAEWLEGRRRE